MPKLAKKTWILAKIEEEEVRTRWRRRFAGRVEEVREPGGGGGGDVRKDLVQSEML